MISCQTVVQLMEKMAPKKLAAEWDNPGLALGSYSDKISKILLTLTVTEGAIKYAVENGFDMIISHHPLFFKPLKTLRRDTPLGQILYKAIKHNISIYSSHTNMDIAEGGVNDILAHTLNLTDIKVLKKTYEEELRKLVVFVPRDYEDRVRKAMGDAGAGHIGKYSHCSFAAHGFGSFKPLEDTSPFIGEQGKLEQVEETRLETIVPEGLVNKVINGMLRAHPYEEVAFDVYPLKNAGKSLGLGRIGVLEESMSLRAFCELVKQKLFISDLRAVGDLDKQVSKIAVCGGAGSDFSQTASFFGADVLVTGDVKYHEAIDAMDINLAIVDAGHYATENLLLPVLQKYLLREINHLGKKAEISIFEDRDPFVFI